jgi:hypothetical protein
MTPFRPTTFSILLLALLSTQPTAAQPKPAEPPKPTPAEPNPNDITAKLWSRDPKLIDEAVKSIYSYPARRRIDLLKQVWMQQLTSLARYKDITLLTQDLIELQPNYTDDLGFLLKNRAKALLAMKDPAAAIQDAKRMFNVVPAAEVPDSLLLIEECLLAAGDTAAAESFRNEQLAAAQDPAKTSPTFIHIEIDNTLYFKPDAGITLEAGNRLLLQDKPDQAEVLFRQMLTYNPPQREKLVAVQGIARTIRARTGSLAAHNQFLDEWLVKFGAPAAASTDRAPLAP